MTRTHESPRSMSEKLLSSHGAMARGADLVDLKTDQVVLAREPNRVLGLAVAAGLQWTQPEVCVAYPPRSVSVGPEDAAAQVAHRVPPEALRLGLLVAQPGAGFAGAVHLERFAGPGRVAVSDDPRLAVCGAVGMLALPASRSQLSEALRTGRTQVRRPRSIFINLTGRLRPFVSARDLTLELLQGELPEAIRRADATHEAPIILEFGGPATRVLSVGERAILCGLAPLLGAASALFASDDKTEFFLKDQRRSKAHRPIHADSGARYEATIDVELGIVEPLARQPSGKVVPIRELEGLPVSQVLLGGDSGIQPRDLLVAAALLKSKRVPTTLEFLLCPPSRQCLELLSRTGALGDLLGVRARLIEPDRRVLSGELYGLPLAGGDVDAVRLRNADPEEQHNEKAPVLVASPDSLAFAIAQGHVGDPRQFRRTVRVNVPRGMTTDDVLLSRGKDARGQARGKGRKDSRADESSPVTRDSFAPPPPGPSFQDDLELRLSKETRTQTGPYAYVAADLEDLRRLVAGPELPKHLRAVVATHIPAPLVSLLSGVGVFALRAEEPIFRRIGQARVLSLPAPSGWKQDGIVGRAGGETVEMQWLARGIEREWAR